MFWKLHIGGWVAYFLIRFAGVYDKYQIHSLDCFLWFLTPLTFAFAITLFLRSFYRILRNRVRSVWKVLYSCIVTSFILANLLAVIQTEAAMLLLEKGPVRDKIIGLDHFHVVFEWSLPLLAWGFLYHSYHWLREWQREVARTEKAQALARNARLRLLRFQLNPHFVFNTLNSVRGLILEDKQGAKQIVSDLSRFLHYSLRQENLTMVPFSREIEALKLYLSIEKRRYEEKLDVTFDVDPAVDQIPILSFLLNPLVENAVKYGMHTSSLPLRIRIAAEQMSHGLRVTVANTGRWIPAADDGDRTATGTGTGLDNIRQRLANAYPDRHRFGISTDGDWVKIRLDIEESAAHE